MIKWRSVHLFTTCENMSYICPSDPLPRHIYRQLSNARSPHPPSFEIQLADQGARQAVFVRDLPRTTPLDQIGAAVVQQGKI
jgi:hypothetical protein